MPSNGALVPLASTALFTPLQVGSLALKHRVVMAPLTRMRCDVVDGVHVPSDRMVAYYSQRATDGGLLLSEATDIVPLASGYPRVPGVFAPAQLAGWRRVTDAVHAKGGRMVAQLWHTGRASSSAMRGGVQPWSSSALPMQGTYLDGTACADDPPRAITAAEIGELVAAWAAASRAAVEEGGFDGVEIHGANGYLLEQFLHDNINCTRTDAYGGSVANRCRFVLEVVVAVCAAVGAGRVGLRLSPFNYFQDTHDSDPNAHWAHLCRALAALPADQRPAYVHMVEPRFDEVLSAQQKLDALAQYTSASGEGEAKAPNSLAPFRAILQEAGIAFLACGTITRDTASGLVETGATDLVVFGRHFLANPDFVERLRNGWPLNAYDRATFYGADPLEKGYTDYPVYKE